MRAILTCAAFVSGLKIGVMSDSHIMLRYHEDVKRDKYCSGVALNKKDMSWKANPRDALIRASFGRYKCDPPV
jgi:hypothetical protein